MQPYPQSTSNATRFTATGIIAFVLDDLLTLLVNNRYAFRDMQHMIDLDAILAGVDFS